MLADNKVSAGDVGTGSGKDGRITKGDVLDFLNRPAPAPACRAGRESPAPG